MNVRRSLTRLAALTVVVAMPLAGISGVASAKATKAASPKCVKHPSKPKCQNAGGGATGGATGNGSSQLTVQVDPEPLVETGQSEVHVVIQVESLPSFAGDAVNIDSSQLEASCATLTFENLQVPGGGPQTVPPTINIHKNQIDAVLDDDGNATVIADGIDCAPGTDVIEADLEVAPFLTGLTTLVVSPPAVTPEGLSVNPRFGGLNQELETGDTSTSGDSNIYAVFYVETNPVYAERRWRSARPSSRDAASRAGSGGRQHRRRGRRTGGQQPRGRRGPQHRSRGVDHPRRRRQRRLHLQGCLLRLRSLAGHRRRGSRQPPDLRHLLHGPAAGSGHLTRRRPTPETEGTVNARRRALRLAALATVLALPLAVPAGVASAKSAKAATSTCVKHPSRAKCRNAGGGATGGGTGGGSAQITVQVDPQPVVETGQSEVHVVIQVEASPSFAGDLVNIDSSQLEAACGGTVLFENLQHGGVPEPVPPVILHIKNHIGAVLDDDGNATVVAEGTDCAPGTAVIEADLEVAPFLTALTTLVVSPPAVTPEGLTVYPRFGGLNQELETGDTAASGDSDIYAVFYVETSPVYAEQTVEIGSAQLEARCVEGWDWNAGNTGGAGAGPGISTGLNGVGPNTGPEASTFLDDDGNAVFIFQGVSCASGPSQVIADVEAGSHPTYVTSFTVLPPAPVI